MAESGSAVITILGSVNMDLVVTSDKLPAPGQTLLGNSFRTVPGGKGSNQAIAAAKAGGHVVFLGAVGDDQFGRQLSETLTDAGVDTSLLRRVCGASGIAAITVDAEAENFIVVVPGANSALRDLTPAEEQGIAESAMLVCQLEIPLETVVAGASIAQRAGVTVLLNPSPVQELPQSLIAATDILIVNEGEAEVIGEAAQQVPHLIVTLGSKGARYRGPDGASFEVAAPKVSPVDTTGAGDAFAGALAVAWSEGQEPLRAVQFACCAGALATTVPGASVSSPARSAINELVAATY